MTMTCPCLEMAEMPEPDFIVEAVNVYRTAEHIVKQKLFVSKSNEMLIGMTGSSDIYYARTAKRDREYEKIFACRGENIDGRRVKIMVYTRDYVD